MPSGVSLTGMAFLDNPRQQGKSKMWFFDANMFLSRDGDNTTGISGCLRYFNVNDLQFGPAGLYNVHAWVGQMNQAYDLGADADKDSYDFVGNIQWLILLHEELEADTQRSDADGGELSELALRMPKINTEYRPYVTFSGVAFNTDKPMGKFDLDAEQYTLIAKGGPTTVFPVSSWIIDSLRWANTAKPVPFPEKFVTASGHLVAVENLEVPGSAYKRRFKVHVDNVIYLGSAKAAGSGPSTPAPNKRKQTFDATPSWVKCHKNPSGAPSSSPSAA
ncbi:hypothetical protein B0H10DRAFT_2211374 [Mycena sp. CBHHK59/15]|nr:hypothetical protein B0H10DRAFT_2211374 [Mycena sp. CBHHK59/15]